MADDVPTLIQKVNALLASTSDLTIAAFAAISSRIVYGSGPPAANFGSDGNLYRDIVNEVEYGPKANGQWGAGRSVRGAPGGSVESVGASAGMLVNPSLVPVPAGTTVIRTSDPGGPAWRYRADAASLAATIPGAIIYDSTGRGFVLDELILTPEMFGAMGGSANDTVAMQRLSAFVNWRKHGIISFRAGGTYKVGRQSNNLGAGPAFVAEQVLNFIGVDGLVIMGNGANIINDSGLRYGSFTPSTGERYDPPAGGFADAKYRADVGHILQVVGSKRISIDGLKIDGNAAGIILGGYWGDKGYQIPGDCLRVTTSAYIAISNMELINAPHDCLYLNNLGNVKGTTTNQLDARTTVDNVNCDLAGRQGCSVTGGSGVTFTNCSFNRSGQGAIQSPPMAGCDIEPVDRWASNITFNQCEFVANGGVALINDSGATGKVTVNSCEIWAGFDGTMGGLKVGGGHAILVDHEGWTFNDTIIHGSCPTLEDDTTFHNCEWDCATHPLYGPSGTNVAYLINSGGGMFYDTTFTIPIGRSVPILTAARPGRVAVNCTFNYGGNPGDAGVGTLGNRTFQDCNFNGTRPIDGSVVRPAWNTGGAAFTPLFRGNNVVSGMCSVSNIVDGEIPETFTPQTRKQTFRASDAAITNNLLYTDEYRAAVPTSGFYRTGSIVRNTANLPGLPSRWECTTEGAIATVAWAENKTYMLNDMVTNDTGKTYVVTKAGVSGNSGGPVGTSAAITTDGSITWRYYAAFVFTPCGYDVPGVLAVATGAAAQPVAAATKNTLRWTGVFTVNKTATIAAAGAIQGRRYRFVRAASATGAFTLSVIDGVGSTTLKALNAGEWCEAEFDGTNWILTAFGTGV